MVWAVWGPRPGRGSTPGSRIPASGDWFLILIQGLLDIFDPLFQVSIRILQLELPVIQALQDSIDTGQTIQDVVQLQLLPLDLPLNMVQRIPG